MLESNMRTERQIQASRANGAKSRGPVTPEGKQTSAKNAITHGMLAESIVLGCESPDRFLAVLQSLLDEFEPQTPFEESLIEAMAAARWRQMRIWSMEKANMENRMQMRAEMSSAEEEPATRAAMAFRALGDDGRSLDLINRYESRFERQYLRAYRCFMEAQDRRTPPPARSPQSSKPRLAPVLPFQPPPAPPLEPALPEDAAQQSAPETDTPEIMSSSKRTRRGSVNTRQPRSSGYGRRRRKEDRIVLSTRETVRNNTRQ
jgi:hypothetical protein